MHEATVSYALGAILLSNLIKHVRAATMYMSRFIYIVVRFEIVLIKSDLI